MAALMNPDEIADKVARAVLAAEGTGPAWGIAIEEAREGYARIRMTLTPAMLNGHRIAHGGMIFALADTAFAYACNARNDVAVAASCNITYTNPAKRGDRLIAECVERFHRGRTGVYDVTVTDQEGQVVALFLGNSRHIGGKVVPDLEIGE